MNVKTRVMGKRRNMKIMKTKRRKFAITKVEIMKTTTMTLLA